MVDISVYDSYMDTFPVSIEQHRNTACYQNHLDRKLDVKQFTENNFKGAARHKVNSEIKNTPLLSQNDKEKLHISHFLSKKYWLLRFISDCVQAIMRTDEKYFIRIYSNEKIDASYSKFDEMPGIFLSTKTKNLLQKKKGLSTEFVKRLEEKVGPEGYAMTLGMLPGTGFTEAVSANAQARENIRNLLTENGVNQSRRVDFFQKLDDLNNALLVSESDDIRAMKDDARNHYSLNRQYKALLTILGDSEMLDKALKSADVDAEKRLDALMTAEHQTQKVSKPEAIEKKLRVLGDVDKLRYVFRCLNNSQRALFKDKMFEQLPLSLTEQQQRLIDQQGGFQSLHEAYRRLYQYGEKLADDLVLVDHIEGYRVGEESVAVASIVQSFELDAAIPNSKALAEPESLTDLGEGCYSVRLQDSLLQDVLGRKNVEWMQFSTRDRSMLTPKLLSQAIDYLRASIVPRKKLFVHCKSGKGRSATVVVGTRTDAVISAFNHVQVALSKNEIRRVIDDQIQQVKSVRPTVDVNPLQKWLLVYTLHERQKVRSSLIDEKKPFRA